MESVSPPRKPLAPHSMPERIRRCAAASYATVPPPAFPPPDPKCSSGSTGPPDPHPPSDDRDWAKFTSQCSSPTLVTATFFGSSFSFSFPTSSASTSFVSRCTGPRDFARFVVGSLFSPELLCFFKVDLLSRFDCTLECVDHW